ncbi:MAG: hypothetical protein IPJ65_06245 [Archangiaceae bacterium]|nr:hypothetical protein [Archangiaceae bacterium]
MRLLPLLALGVACGGPSNSFTGTVSGTSLEIKDAVVLSDTEVWLSSVDQLCEKLTANTYPKSGRIVKIQLHPVATGEFKVQASSSGADHNAFMQFIKLDDSCAMQLGFGESVASKGSLTVAHFEALKSMDGTFDVTFGSSDAVKGSFSARYCAAGTTYPTPECH